ncbi:GNAT family N-acetyltransferase [Microbacterium sp. KKR3/1]|uniref:GNAT family N-acetyltransferase n=1 Tax=unclassified Microbacterium TaxID=2609290 RepID=UPI00106B2BF2|nr:MULTISPECIES: GNAT family N-acetyltransferase [unclassified Microbacterium]MCE0507444.1 GNAT family N-acetyltransferase [Microbacterium sp. KKR3/1]TFB15352.1 N-acetyltransferase [Microbacterium sp. 3H14]UUE19303.1 GNAT family N-acetyltransferase [Microbacterium sp. J1-1]
MTITVERGDTLGEAYRRRITEVLVQGFAEDFEFFSKDPRVLADAFAHMILLDRFFVALVDGEPAAIASVTEGQQECFDPDRREIQRTLGGLRGLVCSFIVRSQFLGAYEGARPGLAEIGFVTTAPQHQGKGVATALMSHLLQLPYDEFVLRDIKDTNAPALGLYRKFGFTESSSRRVRFAGRAGFSAYVSMSLKAVAS